MSTATPEQIASWPTPNYVDPDTRLGLVLGIEIPFVVITVAIIVARMVAPLYTSRRLEIEDWLMSLACVGISLE